MDVSCLGHNCGGGKGERRAGDDEWCEVLLAQHVPQGAYIDVDEVKVCKYRQALKNSQLLFVPLRNTIVPVGRDRRSPTLLVLTLHSGVTQRRGPS